MTLQQLKDEARKKFDEKFTFGDDCRIYRQNNFGDLVLDLREIKDFIDSLITKAYEEGENDALLNYWNKNAKAHDKALKKKAKFVKVKDW